MVFLQGFLSKILVGFEEGRFPITTSMWLLTSSLTLKLPEGWKLFLCDGDGEDTVGLVVDEDVEDDMEAGCGRRSSSGSEKRKEAFPSTCIILELLDCSR